MKKKIIIILILILINLIGIGSYLILRKSNDDKSNNTIKNCAGKVMKNGNGIDTCFIQTGDTGKACTDKKDCDGVCAIEKLTDTSGKCSAFIPFSGCSYVLEDGKTIGPICE